MVLKKILLVSVLIFNCTISSLAQGIKVIRLKKFPKESILWTIEKELQYSVEEIFSNKKFPSDSLFQIPIGGSFGWSGFGLTLSEYLNSKRIKNKSSSSNRKRPHHGSSYYKTTFYPDKKKEVDIIWNSFFADSGEVTFSQLNILKSLQFWREIDPNRSRESSILLSKVGDVRRMYDPILKKVLQGRPTNYLAVAAQIATLAREQKFEKDEFMVNSLVDFCIQNLEHNGGWLNDGKDGEFRFDRYHFEYIRFVWESTERIGRKDFLKRLEPICDKSDSIWLSLIHPISGSTFAYGRSLQNTWEDSWEYGAFMLTRKARSTKEQKQILAMMKKSWNFYFEEEYNQKRHVSRMLDTGRACYSYVSENRIWGYSVHAFGKMLASLSDIKDLGFDLETNFSKVKPQIGNNFFKLKDQYGIWVIRSQNTRLVVPIVTGIGRPKNSDYQPIPFAEGISEPPVGLATTHLLPGIYKNGKMYLPDLKLVSKPKSENPDSIILETRQWISKSDTLPWEVSPLLTAAYKFSKSDSSNKFSMKYKLQNLEKAGPDSIVYSIWKSKWRGSPYEIDDFEPGWEIAAPGFMQKEFTHDLKSQEGRGAFTGLPGRTDMVSYKPNRNLYWNVNLIYP